METNIQKAEKFSQSITMKGIIVFIMTVLLLIPGSMIENLIMERQQRSVEAIQLINEKWSLAQTVKGPVLIIPYQITTIDTENKPVIEQNKLIITPELLKMDVNLIPEERHLGIFKSILYKSKLNISGKFKNPLQNLPQNAQVNRNEISVRIGISDLRGLTNNVIFKMNNEVVMAEAGGINDAIGQGLVIMLNKSDSLFTENGADFSCSLNLNGSGSINFVPVGKNTQIQMKGSWAAPGFIGSFLPEYSVDKDGFNAKWNILHFNRNIPESWTNGEVSSISDSSFGVNLVDTVNHYQQNLRSAKYALMFIALTFVVFFFVEVITRKKIHPVQYLLVGIALILFYSLLLSISEQLNFAIAYLIASFATISMITIYAHSIFKNITQTGILATILAVLYIFLFVVLQLEDIALLIGSIGLFVILAIIMFVSRKINWYRQEV